MEEDKILEEGKEARVANMVTKIRRGVGKKTLIALLVACGLGLLMGGAVIGAVAHAFVKTGNFNWESFDEHDGNREGRHGKDLGDCMQYDNRDENSGMSDQQEEDENSSPQQGTATGVTPQVQSGEVMEQSVPVNAADSENTQVQTKTETTETPSSAQ